MKSLFVYILASKRNGTLYTGFTDDLSRRIWEHREKIRKGFTKQYDVARLVWCEPHEIRESARIIEWQIKKWNREWKLRMIEEVNPDWNDLYQTLNH